MKNILREEFGTAVETTGLSKKITIDGVTKAYPVYRVLLDRLFYNDQNDRIATWISQYKNENGEDAFSKLSREEYNSIIEQFIIQSNEAAIEKTQMNIALVNQREPGVILSDGRIIDGNRRFTCLRRLASSDAAFNWFETIILDTNIERDKKQIKMLELAIQHGEEKKVDYNPIDRLVGVYQDIIETELLTVAEYALSTNETEFEVKKRIESAMLIAEFLDYIHMPKQWHIARNYQIVSAITDLKPLLHKCATVEMQQKVKNAVFSNMMMQTMGDGRKYIKNLSSMMESGFFSIYIKEQEKMGETLSREMEGFSPKSKKELDLFVSNHEEEAEALRLSLDKSLLKAKKHETRNKPSQIVSKSITLLKDVDTRIFEKLTDSERDNLKEKLDRLSTVINGYNSLIDSDDCKTESSKQPVFGEPTVEKVKEQVAGEKRFYIACRNVEAPVLCCRAEKKVLTSLCVTLLFTVETMEALGETNQSTISYKVFFVDKLNTVVSDVKELSLTPQKTYKETFTLLPKAAAFSECFLVIQGAENAENEAEQLIRFEMNIPFAADFDFA